MEWVSYKRLRRNYRYGIMQWGKARSELARGIQDVSMKKVDVLYSFYKDMQNGYITREQYDRLAHNVRGMKYLYTRMVYCQ